MSIVKFFKLLGIGFFSFFTISAYSQGTFKFYDDVTVPQTDAWSFVRQGDISPSMYTGTLNLSVPIYTYRDRDFTLPITALYASNGNTPNQLAGWLGPGWSLNVGGCITIETNGIPDYGENIKHVPGFYSIHKGPVATTNGTYWLNSHNPNYYWRFMRNRLVDYGSGSSAPEINIVTDFNSNKPNALHTYEYDALPDIFHFTLPGGHSGSFHLDFNRNIVVYNTPLSGGSDYRVEIEEDPTPLSQSHVSRFKSITIISPTGYRYVFDGSTGNACVDMSKSCERLYFDLINAWHLTRIVAPNGRWVSFEYTSYPKTVYRPGNAMVSGGVSDNQYYSSEPIIEYYCATGLGDEGGRSRWTDTRSATLKRIVFCDSSQIVFSHSILDASLGDQYRPERNTPLYTYPNTIRLSAIDVYIGFEQRHVASATFAHKRNTNGAQTSYLGSITIQGEGTYSFDYHGWNDASKPYPPHNCYGVDHWGFYNGKNGNYYPQSNIEQQTQKEVIIGTSRNPDADFAKLGMLSKVTYPTGGWSSFAYEPHTCSAAIDRSYNAEPLKSFAPRLIAYTAPVGGLRIKQINSYLSNGTLSLSKEYSYTDALGNSSGILTWLPRYSIAFYSMVNNFLTESSIYRSSSLQDYGFNNIEYVSVVENVKDSSKTVHVFTSSADGEGFIDKKMISGTTAERAILSTGIASPWVPQPGNPQPLLTAHDAVSPITSFSSERGKLKQRIVYKSHAATSPSFVENIQFQKMEYYSPLPCYLVRQFGLYNVFTGKYYPASILQTTRANDIVNEEVKQQFFSYNHYGEVIAIKEPQPKGDTIITEYKHLRDLSDSQINASAVYKAMRRRNMLSLPLYEKIYIKKAGSSQKVLIGGKVCTYALFPNSIDTLILPSYIDNYDETTNSWRRETTFALYDAYGNIKELYDAQHTPISYLWSSDGQYLVLQAKGVTQQQIEVLAQQHSTPLEWSEIPFSVQALRNAYPMAEITAIEHIKGVGPYKIEDAENNLTLFSYTRWGKLKQSKKLNQTTTKTISTTLYSNDQ